METLDYMDENWTYFQAKVEELFTAVYKLPDDYHQYAVDVIGGRLCILKESVSNQINTSEQPDTKQPFSATIPDVSSPDKISPVVLFISPDDSAQPQPTDQLNQSDIAPELPPSNVNTPVKKKRGRPPGKSKLIKTLPVTPSRQSNRTLKVSPKEDATPNNTTNAVASIAIKNEIILPPAEAIEGLEGQDVNELVVESSSTDKNETQNSKGENKKVKQCPHCDKMLTTLAGYNYHMKKHSEREFRCPYDCKYVGITRRQLKIHLKTTHGITHNAEAKDKFQCRFCERSFAARSLLKFHERIHTKGPLKCPHCPKEFTSQPGFTQHVNQHTGQNLHSCPHCSFTSSALCMVHTHVRAVHDKLRPYLCEACGRGFVSSHVLKKHVEGTHKLSEVRDRYSCPHCPHKTHCSVSLKAHIRNLHGTGDATGYTCDICGETLKYKHSLKLHQMRHYSEKNYQCPDCDFKATCEKNVKEHYKRVHRDVTFACDVCDKVFRERSHLLRHQVIHTGEKRYQCEQCTYKCNVKHNLRKHMVNVHKLDVRVRKPIAKVDQTEEVSVPTSENVSKEEVDNNDASVDVDSNDASVTTVLVSSVDNTVEVVNPTESFISETQDAGTIQETVYTILDYSQAM